MENSNKTSQIKLLEAFAKSTKGGIQIANKEGRLVFINAVSRKRLGLSNQKELFVWDFEPYFKTAEDWSQHIKSLKESGPKVIRSSNFNLLTKEYIPVEVRVFLQHIDGEDYVFAETREIADIIEKETVLGIRETMLLAISDATSELLYNNDFFQAVVKVLGIIGKAVNVDRTYLFTCSFDENGEELVSQRSEWNSNDTEPQINNPDLQNVPLSLFDDFVEMMRNNIPFQSIVAELDEGSELKAILESQAIISILILPVFHKGEFWGFIGYDECKYARIWDDVEVSILQTLSNNMASALNRLDYDLQIENLAEFPMENPAPIIRIDKEGKLLFQNKIDQIEGEYFKVLGSNSVMSLDELMMHIANDVALNKNVKYYEVQTSKNFFYSITAKEIAKKSYINLYFSDTSKLKLTEKELRKTRTIVDQVVSNMEDVVWSVSYPDFKALYVSPSTKKLYGIDAKKFYDNSQIWVKNIVEEDKDIVNLIFQNIEKNGESDVQYRITTSHGVKWVNNRVKIIRDDTGKVYRLDGLITNITNQKQINEELQLAKEEAIKSNMAKEAFIANISHEIRTPLNAILGLSNLLKDEKESFKSDEYLYHIIHSARHLHSLIENVLDMAKMSEGKISLNQIDFKINDVLKTIQSIFKPLVEEKGLKLVLEIDKKLSPYFKGDYLRIKQVLINILSNAVKFTEKGTIVLRVKVEKEKKTKQVVAFSISDTGIGIEKAFLTEIFKKFSRSDRVNKQQPGAGLGMAISHELIKIMGGKIQVDSCLGKGTVVNITLPLLLGEAKTNKQNKKLLNKENKPLKILHAEDNELNRLIVKNILGKYNIELTEVEDGQQALDALKNNLYDCVLLDIQMPKKDGFEVARIAREDYKIKTPIIGVSANALTSQIKKSKENGMNEYLTKPFEADALIDVITLLTGESSNLLQVNKKSSFYDSAALTTREYSAEFRKEMIGLFISKMPVYLKELEKFRADKNIVQAKRMIHKIKPSVETFGVRNIRQDLNYFMSIDEEKEIDWHIVNKHIKSFEKKVLLAIKEIETEL